MKLKSFIWFKIVERPFIQQIVKTAYSTPEFGDVLKINFSQPHVLNHVCSVNIKLLIWFVVCSVQCLSKEEYCRS